jgi:hypothetical protein
MLQAFRNTPLPPVPYPYFQRREIMSAVVIGYPMTINQRSDLMDAGAVILTYFDPNNQGHLLAVREQDLVCVFYRVGLMRRSIIRAQVAKEDPRRFCRMIVSQEVDALIEMLMRRKYSGKSNYMGEIAVGRA